MANNSNENYKLMSGYEKRIFKGYHKTAADLLKDDCMVASVLRKCLVTEIEVEEKLESGEKVEVPIIYELVGKKLAYWKANPDKIDLKELSTVLGELKTVTNLNLPQASSIFAGITVDDKPKKPAKRGKVNDSRSG